MKTKYQTGRDRHVGRSKNVLIRFNFVIFRHVYVPTFFAYVFLLFTLLSSKNAMRIRTGVP